jgi:hypothetical protein
VLREAEDWVDDEVTDSIGEMLGDAIFDSSFLLTCSREWMCYESERRQRDEERETAEPLPIHYLANIHTLVACIKAQT